jgi:8-oxo-dGTP diphosphatase
MDSIRELTKGKDYIGVGVGAVVLNESGEVLLILRRKEPEAGQWSIPGGAVEWFEKCADAVKRECLEEVGLTVEVVRLLTVVDHIVPGEESHWVSVEYLVDIVSGEAWNHSLRENADMKWFPPDALPLAVTQPTREALDSYIRMLRGGDTRGFQVDEPGVGHLAQPSDLRDQART